MASSKGIQPQPKSPGREAAAVVAEEEAAAAEEAAEAEESAAGEAVARAVARTVVARAAVEEKEALTLAVLRGASLPTTRMSRKPSALSPVPTDPRWARRHEGRVGGATIRVGTGTPPSNSPSGRPQPTLFIAAHRRRPSRRTCPHMQALCRQRSCVQTAVRRRRWRSVGGWRTWVGPSVLWPRAMTLLLSCPPTPLPSPPPPSLFSSSTMPCPTLQPLVRQNLSSQWSCRRAPMSQEVLGLLVRGEPGASAGAVAGLLTLDHAVQLLPVLCGCVTAAACPPPVRGLPLPAWYWSRRVTP
jgi:hypothetical protein